MKKTTSALLLLFVVQSATASSQAGPMEQLGKQMDNFIKDTIDYSYVITEISKDPLLNNYDIQVKLDGSTAYLIGKVQTDMQYERAITIASSLNRIEDVNADELKIEKSESILQDMATSAKIRGKLLKLKFMQGAKISLWPITVETKNGHVYITGEVHSQEEAQIIDNAIKTLVGVKEVHSDYKVVN